MRSGAVSLHHAAAGFHQAGDTHGEFIVRGFAVAVFVGQHFTLFGELDLAMHGAGRLRQNRFMGRAAAAADGAAAAVEQAAADAVADR